MQQWIPRTQTLEPKIWGQVGLRQGFYLGLGVFAGIFFLVVLSPFGIGPRIAVALLSLAVGATVGFMKIKGLSPERYLFHRLRFGLRRQGLGLWEAPEAPERRGELSQAGPIEQAALSSFNIRPLADHVQRPVSHRVTSVARPTEYTGQAGPFGRGFQVGMLGVMGAAMAYLASGLTP